MKGLDLEKKAESVEGAVVTSANENNAIVPFDMKQTKHEIITQFSREELAAITDQIDITDTNTIIKFGAPAAEEISKCSDSVLNMVEMDQINRAGAMMNALSKIISTFDAKELVDDEPKKKGFLARLTGNTKDLLESIIKKYDTMGGQLDKVCMELRKYETEIAGSNEKLEELFNANINYYKELEKYIEACSIGYEMLDEYKASLEKRLEETGDQSLTFKIQSTDMAKQMLSQREVDLRAAENIAMQSLPMIKMMQYSNLNLNRKINSAFIITIPIFKQNIAQAILLKRQRLQAQALAALDKTTNEMIIKNAQSTADQARAISQMVNGSSIKIETLEQSHNLIMQGIQDCNTIMKDSEKQRANEIQRLIALKEKVIDQKV